LDIPQVRYAFYRAMLLTARLCHSMSSVRLSATFTGYVFHTDWNTSKIISRPNSLGFMLGLTATWTIWRNGNTPKLGWNRSWAQNLQYLWNGA